MNTSDISFFKNKTADINESIQEFIVKNASNINSVLFLTFDGEESYKYKGNNAIEADLFVIISKNKLLSINLEKYVENEKFRKSISEFKQEHGGLISDNLKIK